MEKYKITIGKYKNKSIHDIIKDKSYCKWIKKNNINEELINYIDNYKKYCYEIKQKKLNKLKEIKNQTFPFFKLPIELQRKIFFMKRKGENMDFIIKLNLKKEKYIARRVNIDIFCRACGRVDKKSGFMYCYDCGQMSRNWKNIQSKQYLERIKKDGECMVMCQMNDFYKIKYNRTSWISKFSPGDHAHVHSHSTVDIAGVYYYKTNKEDKNIYNDDIEKFYKSYGYNKSVSDSDSDSDDY